MEAIKKKMAALKEERDDALSKLDDAKAEIKGKLAQNDSVEVEKSNLERKVQLLEGDLEKTEDQLLVVRSDKADLEAKVDDLERENKSLQSSQNTDVDIKEELDSTKKTSERKISDLENDVDDLRRKIKIMEGDLLAADDQNDSYQKKVDLLEKELSEKHHLVINKERSDEQYAQTEEDLRAQVFELKAMLRKEENNTDEAERNVKKLNNDISILEDDLESAERKFDDLKKEHDEMVKDLSEM